MADPLRFIIAAEEAPELMDASEYAEGVAGLIQSGIINHLQGSWQRTAMSMIEAGVFSRDLDGKINVDYERLEEVMA